MKNKKMMYVLIVSVAAVWGIIFYRVFAATAPDTVPAFAPVKALTSSSPETMAMPDTFTLALNYRDPFSDRQSIVSNPAEEVKINLPPPVILNRDYVKYGGYITNPQTKKAVSILAVNNKEQMMSEGEQIADVKLLRNLRDSVKILYKNTIFYVRKTN